jgi:hypothetical protein
VAFCQWVPESSRRIGLAVPTEPDKAGSGYILMDAAAPNWRSIIEPGAGAAVPVPAPVRKPAGSPFGWIRNAPWWLISAGLHVVLLLGAALVYIERSMGLEDGAVEVQLTTRPAGALSEIERPRDVFERKGIPKDDVTSSPTDEPAIFFPEAKESDHNESADGEDYKQMKGESKNFLSYTPGEAGGIRGRQPGKAAGISDSMGVGAGGGGGGRYGARFGGRENLVARGGGGSGTEDAVRAALKWLARHQSPDGSWAAAGFSAQCSGDKCSGPGGRDFDTGVTGLALLAFLGAGYSHLSKDEMPDPARPGKTLRFGEVVKNGLKWLVGQQDPEGCIGPRRGHYMYDHSIAALALSEAFGMTTASTVQGPAQKAIDFLVTAQNPGKGWRYTSRSGDNDTSVTGWAAMALKSAELSGITFPHTSYDGTRAWLDDVTEGTYGRVGYVRKPGPKDTPSMTAIGVMCRIFMDKNKADPRLSNGCDFLLRDKPKWEDGKIDYYWWYYGSLALFQFDGPGGAKWRAWNEDMKNALVKNQNVASSGCRNGSWEAVDRWSRQGGRVYATAINALTLEVYYRYANVFGVSSK